MSPPGPKNTGTPRLGDVANLARHHPPPGCDRRQERQGEAVMIDDKKGQRPEIECSVWINPAHTDDDTTIRKIELLIRSLHDKGMRVAIFAAIQSRALLATR
jgi:hypothetical protein